MENKLKIAVVQTELHWKNIEQNLHHFSEKIEEIKGDVDIIVVPEMFTTGFCMTPFDVAESMEGSTVSWMRSVALKRNCAIAGSVIVFENENYYNRFLFVQPNGSVVFYNKKHLFTLAGEEKIYTAGNEKIILEYKGWKIRPLVCYDLRFPVWSRNDNDYDLLLYVANWPKPRVNAWDALLKARAIENMCCVVGVNRVGFDGLNYEYVGHSAVYNCLGEAVLKPLNGDQVVLVELDKEHLDKTRNRFNFLNDRDAFEIK